MAQHPTHLGNLGVAAKLAHGLDSAVDRILVDVPQADNVVIGCAQQLAGNNWVPRKAVPVCN